MNSHLKIFAVVAAMALLVPAGASAKRPDDKPAKGRGHGKAHKPGKAKTLKTKLVTANVKGSVESNDGSTMTVAVNKASGQAKACKGTTLTFDVSDARFHTADNDADGDMDAADVLGGHNVKVRAKVLLSKGRKTTCSVAEGETLTAKAVHNRATPKGEDSEEVVEDEASEDEELLEDEEELLEDEEELLEDDEELEDEELDEV